MEHKNEVLFHTLKGKNGSLGIITLNRPQVLNSLNYYMVHSMYGHLQTWIRDDNIKAIIIRAAEGKAFCAGGDLKTTYQQQQNHPSANIEFFQAEYLLNRLIFHCPKPYIALLNGITMGGGVGISIHGSHRIATERLVFAMPETTIGFFPDVGGTYFLPRMPNNIGYYAALTGARFTVEDCMALNLTQHYIPSTELDSVIEEIADHPFRTAHPKQEVTGILSDMGHEVGPSDLAKKHKKIASIFSHDTVEEIVSLLSNDEDPFFQLCYHSLLEKSPTSLKVTLKALNSSKNMSFDACMQQELTLTKNFLAANDFMEGIRALIIDKDQNPKWQPANLEDVNNDKVEEYFFDKNIFQTQLESGSSSS